MQCDKQLSCSVNVTGCRQAACCMLPLRVAKPYQTLILTQCFVFVRGMCLCLAHLAHSLTNLAEISSMVDRSMLLQVRLTPPLIPHLLVRHLQHDMAMHVPVTCKQLGTYPLTGFHAKNLITRYWLEVKQMPHAS